MKILIAAIFILISSVSFAHKQTINFTENNGQWEKNIKFRGDIDGGALFVENNSFTYHFYNKEALHQNHINKNKTRLKVNGHTFKMNMVNSNSEVVFKKHSPCPAYKNYFIGNNPDYWASGVKSWEKIIAHNLYKGIDMETEGLQNGIKYQFNVAPNADYTNIKLQFEGITQLELKNNTLIITTSVNKLIDEAPVAWQIIQNKKVEIPCEYVLQENSVSFKLSKKYNPAYPLVIDPVLVFASYTGSTADNFGLTATYDNHGNLYTGGLVYGPGYPTTLGAYDDSYNGIVQYGRTDVSISKFDSTGATLIYSTYLGGADNTEVVHSMVVNSTEELCVFGTTGSSDFPTTAKVYDTSFNGGQSFSAASNGTYFEYGIDIFVSRFSSNGSQLLASTFIGGTENDGLNTASELAYNYGDFYRGEINVDGDDNIVIGTNTLSADFPVTANAVQPIKGAFSDGCIIKFDKNLQNLLYSTFLGGNQNDAVYAITVSGTDVYATGGTSSSDIPTSANAYQPNYAGGQTDGMVFKLSTSSTIPVLASYIGTLAYDQSYFIQLDDMKNVYLFGQTAGSFPYTGAGAYQNPNSGQFIMKLDSSLSTLLLSTTFGNGNGAPNISPSAFLVDDCNHIYICGWGGNLLAGIPTQNMPLSTNAFQSTTDGFDFYLAVFEHDMDSMIYATYFGGNQSHEHVDGGTSRFDKKGIVYQSVCAGCGAHNDFPTTPGAWSNTNNSSNCNNGVFKFDFEIGLVHADFLASPLSGCAPLTVNFINLSPNSFFWDFGNNDTTSTELNPIRTFTSPGVYPVILIIRNINSCNVADTIIKYITVLPGLNTGFSGSVPTCESTVNFTDLTVGAGAPINSWLWDFGDSTTLNTFNPSHTYLNPGTYIVHLTTTDVNGCSGSYDSTIVITALTAQPSITTQCGNFLALFNSTTSGASGYWWNYGYNGNTSSLVPSSFLYPDTGVYHGYLVVYWDKNSCSDTAFFDVTINPAFQASFSFNQDTCSNQVSFTETTSSVGNPSSQWLWSFGDGQYTSQQNPVYTYNNGSYTATLIVTAANSCIDTVSQQLLFNSYNPYFLSADTLLCAIPSDILLQAQGGDFYQWQPPYLFSQPSASNQLVTISSDSTFTVTIGRINQKGDTCRQTFSTTIQVSNLGYAQFHIDAERDTIFEGESTPINVEISNGNFSFLWAPAQGLDNAQTDNVVASPVNTTEYTLTVTEGSLCSRSEKVKIVVFKADCSEASIFVPNTFSPNHDGKNDLLKVRGNYISQLYFAIYNRWGEKVFETNDKNMGWDGTYQGNEADPGVFGWYLKTTCRNGETNEIKGNVTLIR